MSTVMPAHGRVLSVLLWLGLFAVIAVWPEWVAVERTDFWTRQTARVAVLFWASACGILLVVGRSSLARWWWTLACAGYIVHVATAFTQVHHWSHHAAFAHVEDVSGFGPGIFISYGFTLFWIADVLWWWCKPLRYQQRNAMLAATIHGVMAFVVFNGTVVYETGFIRWASLVVFAVLGWLWLRSKSHTWPTLCGGDQHEAQRP